MRVLAIDGTGSTLALTLTRMAGAYFEDEDAEFMARIAASVAEEDAAAEGEAAGGAGEASAVGASHGSPERSEGGAGGSDSGGDEAGDSVETEQAPPASSVDLTIVPVAPDGSYDFSTYYLGAERDMERLISVRCAARLRARSSCVLVLTLRRCGTLACTDAHGMRSCSRLAKVHAFHWCDARGRRAQHESSACN